MDKRDRILDAAERVLRGKGLSGATTRAITTQARCAEGTLYLYFKGRADLFLALFERQLVGAFPLFEALQRSEGAGPHAILLDVGLQFLRFHREAGPLLAALFAEPKLLKQYRSLSRARSPETPRAAPPLIAYLRNEQRCKRITPSVDPEIVAEVLLGACFARAFHDNMFDELPGEAADRKFLRSFISALID